MKSIVCCSLCMLLLNSIYSQKPAPDKLLPPLAESKVKNEVCFAVLLNGDTLRGNTLTKKRVGVSGKVNFFIGNKVISADSIRIYQDEYAYVIRPYGPNETFRKNTFGSEFRRLYVGKISLFMAVTGAASYMEYGRQSTAFYLSTDSLWIPRMVPTTTSYLKEMVSACPAALEQFNQMFKKANNSITVDYNKILAILQKFDSCK